jgi:hypothetical protein
MPQLPDNMLTRFYFYLRVGPIAQTLSIYLLLIGGVSFILLSMASAVFIPRLSLASTQAHEESQWKKDLSSMKKHSLQHQTNTKEMELYYCSLLSTTDENREEGGQDLDLVKLDYLKDQDM